MRLTVLALLGLAATSASSPIAFVERQSNENVTLTLLQTTDRLLFNTSIADFLTARNARESMVLGLDWTADGCSSSHDDPFGFDFHNSCLRHDFGYRNYKLQKRCGDADKERIDDNFEKDMDAECETEEEQDLCEAVASIYFEAVRIFGESAFCQ